MIDSELVAKKLALIETFVRELQTLAAPSAIEHDIRERRFAEHTIQIAVQACQDVASHIVSRERLGEPVTNQQLFQLMRDAGWIEDELADTLRRAVGLRNILVHGYSTVDAMVVRDVVENRLDDLLEFVDAVRRRLETP